MSRKLILALFFLVIASGFGFLYLMPEWERFQKLKTENENLQDVNAELDTLIDKKKDLLAVVEGLSSADRARIERALPVGINAADFFVRIEELSLRSGVTLKSIDAGGTTGDAKQPQRAAGAAGVPRPSAGDAPPPRASTAKQINEFPIGLVAEGTYEALNAFVSGLERNVRLIDIEGINFSSAIKSALPLTFKIKTYYQ